MYAWKQLCTLFKKLHIECINDSLHLNTGRLTANQNIYWSTNPCPLINSWLWVDYQLLKNTQNIVHALVSQKTTINFTSKLETNFTEAIDSIFLGLDP